MVYESITEELSDNYPEKYESKVVLLRKKKRVLKKWKNALELEYRFYGEGYILRQKLNNLLKRLFRLESRIINFNEDDHEFIDDYPELDNHYSESLE
jgi:hypothetical protein